MKRHSIICWSVPALALAASLGGCSWFHRDRVDYYKGAAETRPLEVPPDLDTPSSSKELVVPGSGGATASRAAAGVSTSPQGAAASPGNELRVADTVGNTWQRVGLALDRAQIGKVSARDEATHSYVLDFSGAVASEETAPPEHHWYSRILHPFGGGNSNDSPKTQQVTVGLRININEDAGGARISVVGNSIDKSAPDAARRVIEILRERLS